MRASNHGARPVETGYSFLRRNLEVFHIPGADPSGSHVTSPLVFQSNCWKVSDQIPSLSEEGYTSTEGCTAARPDLVVGMDGSRRNLIVEQLQSLKWAGCSTSVHQERTGGFIHRMRSMRLSSLGYYVDFLVFQKRAQSVHRCSGQTKTSL